MTDRDIRCGILGGQEQDLPILSALHGQENVRIAFVYDRDPKAVGVEIAEILRIRRYHTPAQLAEEKDLDYVVVSEPRQRFSAEVETLSRSGAKLMNPADALSRFAGEKTPEKPLPGRRAESQTIDDTLVALEKLLNRRELLEFLLGVAVEATSAAAGSIMLYSPETEELYIAYATGLSDRVVKRTRQKIGQGIAGMVALDKQPQLLRSAPEHRLYAEDRERVEISSAISVPLLWAGRLLGVLNVSAERSGQQLGEEEMTTLKSLSNRIARVLFQSMKLEEVQLRHQEWKFRTTMGEIADKPISAQEKCAVLSRYLSELMGAETVEIFLNTAEGDWFVLGGSNRLLSPRDRRVRYQRGALGRSFLENRCIVLTEGLGDGSDPMAYLSSVVYCPLSSREARGVIVLEFAERYKLDEFLLIKDAIVMEVSRFLASEMRDRKVARELRALREISNAAPSVLGCRSAENLAEVLANVVGRALESEQVSVRVRKGVATDDYLTRYFAPLDESDDEWTAEDDKKFSRLLKDQKAFSTAFLTFDAVVRDGPASYRTVLAFPIKKEGEMLGGIIAYNKNPSDPMEDAVYSEQDREIVENAALLAVPVLDAFLAKKPFVIAEKPAPYDAVLKANRDRLIQLCAGEMSRSDRYHHSFALVLFEIDLLKTLFESDAERALSIVDDITRGLETRTRKTDFGTWIGPGTYAILTLEAGKRIRFLISRALTYLRKDLAGLEDFPPAEKGILIGSSNYPGTAKSAGELIHEAQKNLKPPSSG
ncbi:MAG: GAF domain-containing protein [Candidatus Latescibacterota bacterium]|nr:MAG: GAF domain-containing protein [Candidatus Latescibacterota bacterium]